MKREEKPTEIFIQGNPAQHMYTADFSNEVKKMLCNYGDESRYNEKEAFEKLITGILDIQKRNRTAFEDLKNFVLLVEQTRQAQKQYFKTRSKLHLEIAVKKEQQTDEEINRLFALYKLGNNKIY